MDLRRDTSVKTLSRAKTTAKKAALPILVFRFVFLMFAYTNGRAVRHGRDGDTTSGPGVTLLYLLVLPLFAGAFRCRGWRAGTTTAIPVAGGFS